MHAYILLYVIRVNGIHLAAAGHAQCNHAYVAIYAMYIAIAMCTTIHCMSYHALIDQPCANDVMLTYQQIITIMHSLNFCS